MKIVILGAGTFGTALANAIHPDLEVTLFTIEEEVVETINNERKNIKYFPNKKLGKNIKATGNYELIADADLVFIALPSHAIVDFFSQHAFKDGCIFVNGAKGFAQENILINQQLETWLPKCEICSIKGPSFASELIFEIPTAFTIASNSKSTYTQIKDCLRHDLIVTDYSSDISGVEYLSITKNIYAIVIGIVDAYYNSPNVRFLVFTKAIAEIRQLMHYFGVKPETLFRYCGIGDLGLTSLNDLSRNRTLGLLIGKGFFDANLSNSIVLEGVRALNNILDHIPSDERAQYPIISEMQALLQNRTTVKKFINKIIFE